MSRTRLIAGLAVMAWLVALPGAPVLAQMFGGGTTAAPGGGRLPVDIDADTGIEWHQEQKAYVARGNATAKRGDTTVFADVLTAYYREAPDGSSDIYRMVAEGKQVRILSPNQDVYGERAVYDADTKTAVVTGRNLRLITPTDVVTARDTLEWYDDKSLAVARGDAIAVRQDGDKMRADVLIGQFARDAAGKQVLDRLDGRGGVVVTTATDVAVSDQLMYSAATKKAILTGNVRLTRGDNQVNGDIAEMDTVTKVNRVLSSGRRVRGFLVPEEREQAGTPGAPAGAGPAAGPATPPATPGARLSGPNAPAGRTPGPTTN